MSRPLRIVAHNGSSILGGGETGTALLLAALRERGHEVLMLCRDAGMAERIAGYGVPTAVFRIGGDLVLPDALAFARRLRSLQPDVLLLTTFRKLFLAGVGARLARVPRVVQRVVLSSDVPRGARYRFAVRHLVDRVVFNAEAMRAPFLAAAPGLDPGRAITLLDGVQAPSPTLPPGALRREVGIPAEAAVIGSVGRLARQKRYDRLVRVLARLPEQVHCVLAGEGEERDALASLAGELGVRDRLHLLGFRRDVGEVLGTLDLFVLCSDREGMANAMLEAMAAGVPVVSTDVSGASEALYPEPDGAAPGRVTGFEEAEISEVIGALLDDRAALADMGRLAARRARDRFGWQRFVDQWEALLAGCDPPPP